jgi:HB1, ASXL, restriction endonuclease HTH domain
MATKRAPKKSIAARAKMKPAVSKKPKPNKLSALDAAAQVLAASKEPMNAKEMIDAMAAKGLWTSPGGKTPHATLYSAILREIGAKGKEARFKKTDRGHFIANW